VGFLTQNLVRSLLMAEGRWMAARRSDEGR
jgi:hypothetical protein